MSKDRVCQCRVCKGFCPNETAYAGWRNCRSCSLGWHKATACDHWEPYPTILTQNAETPLCKTCGHGRLKHKGEKR